MIVLNVKVRVDTSQNIKSISKVSLKVHSNSEHCFPAVQCSGGQVYQECGRPCGASCADLWRGWSCERDEGGGNCVPGCQCPDGLAQDGQGQCVPVHMCPCTLGDQLHPAGSTRKKNCNSW